MSVSSNLFPSFSNKNSYVNLPTCSSSIMPGDIEPPAADVKRNVSSLHAELIRLNIVDDLGNVIQKGYVLPPHVIDEPVDAENTPSLFKECFIKFVNHYRRGPGILSSDGDSSDWHYCSAILKDLGVVNPEEYFHSEVRKYWSLYNSTQLTFQQFIDRMLLRVNLDSIQDDSEWLNAVCLISKGYRIVDKKTWNLLLKYQLTKENAESLESAIRNSVPSTQLSRLTHLINILAFSNDGLSRTATKNILKGLRENGKLLLKCLPPELQPLYKLLAQSKGSNHEILALLEICAFLRELFVPHSDTSAISVGVIAPQPAQIASLHVQFTFKSTPETSIQLKCAAAEAYSELLSLCRDQTNEPEIIKFVSEFLLPQGVSDNPESLLAYFWSDLKMNVVGLRKQILANLNTSNKSLQLINFLLLAALKRVETPSPPINEIAMMQLLPAVYESKLIPVENLSLLVERTLGSAMAKAFACFVESEASQPNVTAQKRWLLAMLQVENSLVDAKLCRLALRYHDTMSDADYKDMIDQVLTQVTPRSPPPAIELLLGYLEKIDSLDPSHFNLFCQALICCSTPESRSLLQAHTKELEHVLRKFLNSHMEGLTWSPITERVLYHVIDHLLDHEPESGGKSLLKLAEKSCFRPLFGRFLPVLSEKAFPKNHDAGVLPAKFEEEKKKLDKYIANSTLQAAVYTLTQMSKITCADQAEQIALEDAIDTELKRLWDLLAKRFSNAPQIYVAIAMELIHAPEIRNKYPSFCLEKHLGLIEELLKPQSKFKDTLRYDFIMYSLSHFYPILLSDDKVMFTPKLVELMSIIESKVPVKENNDIALIQNNAVTIIMALENNLPFQVLFLSFIASNSIRLNAGHGAEDLIVHTVSRVLREGSLTFPQQKLLVKYVYNEFRNASYPFDMGDLFLFAQYSFQNGEIELGLYWVNALLKIFEDENIPVPSELFPVIASWLSSLNANKKYGGLFSLLNKYDRTVRQCVQIETFFTEEFVNQLRNTLLPYLHEHLMIDLFESDRQRSSEIAEKTIRAIIGKSPIADVSLKMCIDLLLRTSIDDSNLWLEVFEKLKFVETPAVRKSAFHSLRNAVQNNLLKDSEKRIICWLLATSGSGIISYDDAVNWLKNSNELMRVFSRSDDDSVSVNLLFFYKSLYKIIGKEVNTETAQLLTEAHQHISDTFMFSRDRIEIWELDSIFLDAITKNASLMTLSIVFNIFKNRFSANGATDTINPCASLSLMQLARIEEAHRDVAPFLTLFLDELIQVYGKQKWLLRYFIEFSLVANRPRVKYLLSNLKSILDICGKNWTAARIHKMRQVMKEHFSAMISKLNKKHPDFVMDFFTSDEVRGFCGDDLKDVVDHLIIAGFGLRAKNGHRIKVENVNSSHSEASLAQLGRQLTPLENDDFGTSQVRNMVRDLRSGLALIQLNLPKIPQSCHAQIWHAVETKIDLSLRNAFRKAKTSEYLHDQLQDIAWLAIKLCKLEFEQSVVPGNLYSNVEKIFSRISQHSALESPATAYYFAYYIIKELFIECESDDFVQIEELQVILEDFIFQMNIPNKGDSSVFYLIVDLITEDFNALFEMNQDVPFFQNLENRHLRGFADPLPFLRQLVQSKYALPLSLFLRCLEVRDFYPKSISLSEVEEVLFSFLDNLRGTPTLPWKKRSFNYLAIGSFNSFIGRLCTSGNVDELNLARRFCFKLIDTFINTPLHVVSVEEKIQNFALACDILRKAPHQGFFDKEPDKYWDYCRTIYHTLTVLIELYPKEGSKSRERAIIFSGLALSCEPTLNRVCRDDVMRDPVAKNIFRDLVARLTKLVIEAGEGPQLLEQIHSEGWANCLINCPRLAELIEGLSSISTYNRRRIPEQLKHWFV